MTPVPQWLEVIHDWESSPMAFQTSSHGLSFLTGSCRRNQKVVLKTSTGFHMLAILLKVFPVGNAKFGEILVSEMTR